jgi:hypothetical protein
MPKVNSGNIVFGVLRRSQYWLPIEHRNVQVESLALLELGAAKKTIFFERFRHLNPKARKIEMNEIYGRYLLSFSVQDHSQRNMRNLKESRLICNSRSHKGICNITD